MPLRELSVVSVALFRRAGLTVPATDSARRMYGGNGRKVRELQQEAVYMYDVNEAFHAARSVVDTTRCGQKLLYPRAFW